MVIVDKDIKKFSIAILILLLGVLAFLIVKPIILSIIGGLLLAYIFMPIFRRINKSINNRTFSAIVVSIIGIVIIFIPLWFIIPTLMQEVFEIFQLSQKLNIYGFIQTIFPNATDQVISQMSITLNSFVSKISSGILDSLVSFLLDLPTVLLHLAVIAFVFFFSLRDADKLKDFMSGLSPLKKDQEAILVKKFRDITDSIIYGQVIVGIVQGILAGVGLIIFKVPNAFVLSALAVVASIIPNLGPAIIWVPVAVYLIAFGNPVAAVAYLVYNILIVSFADNLLRVYIISKKTDLPAGIVFVSMIGGLFVFGILGLILGPLIIAYFLTFLQAYKAKTLSSMFEE